MEKVAPDQGDINLDRQASNQCLQTQHREGIRWAGNKLGPDCSERKKALEIRDGGKEGSPATAGFISEPEHSHALKHDGKIPI